MKLALPTSLFLLALASPAFANPVPVGSVVDSITVSSSPTFYFGIFGGSGSSNNIDATQYGTAFFIEAQGGALAVDAFGKLDSHNAPFIGVQLGYHAPEILLNPFSLWTLTPAVELEGFVMSRESFEGDLINNTARLPEHDFLVSYPTRNTVFLANALLNFNYGDCAFHPYVGFGIGNAILRISDASALQIDPPEAGINHYNANTGDTTSTFAGQIKLGLNYDINTYISLIAEYRWLYLASTPFVFGSTIYPGHAATSPWEVKLGAQRYNLGNVGIRVNL